MALSDALKDAWSEVLQAREQVKTCLSREKGMLAVGRANLAYVQAVKMGYGDTAKINWETGEVSVRS